MEVIKTNIKDLLVLKPVVHGDHRGWFSESYSKKQFKQNYLNIDFIQDNHSFTEKIGTIRGLHFQLHPKAQTKLVRCTRGKILDVVVDLRKGSKTYLQSFSIELSEDNNLQLLVPHGFAHGFLTLTDNVEVQYKVDEYYSFEHDRSVRFDDETFNIDWGIVNPILSDKDKNAPLYKDSDANFTYNKEDVK